MKKRIVCLLLTLMMALTMAFVPALAESEAPAFCLTFYINAHIVKKKA